VLDQDPVVVAASLELIVVIVVRMAVDGVTSQPPIVQHALAASTPPQVLHSALAMATTAILLVTKVAVASGAMTVVIAATMVRGGVTSPAPIVQHVQECLTAVLRRQGAGEMDAVVLPHASVSKKSSFMWH